MIGGTHSGAGKTTWSLALMALARKKGLSVQPFKVGPDYIDPGFHTQVCSPRKSRNLDLFLLSPDFVQNSFWKNSAGADLAVVEGVMGLFDGKSAVGEEGSTAQMAKLLGLPVFLVIDGSAMATSAAAIALGFQDFDPGLKIAGILLDRVNSDGHFTWLKCAIEEKTGIPCLGYLPREESIRIPERHLGLVTAAETGNALEKIEKAAALLESRFDWDQFLRVCEGKRGLAHFNDNPLPIGRTSGQLGEKRPRERCRIAVAFDKAFSFYYEDNFDLLREAGAELVFFSPLTDTRLPEGIDLLYFGGGFPELFAPQLAGNHSMIETIRNYYRRGGYIYAECGGLMYLAESCAGADSKDYPLAGLVPGRIRMTDRLQNFGYHEFETASDTFLFPKGKRLRSHEFHYSVWDGEGKVSPAYVLNGRLEGFAGERIVASYQHVHFGYDPAIAVRLVENLRRNAAFV